MATELSLDNLSEQELRLYKVAISVSGYMDEKAQKLLENGTFEEYRVIHNKYLELYNTTLDDKIKLESLKRLIFLNWYSVVEPSCFTGVDNLNEQTTFDSYLILNDYIKLKKLDDEFVWMLSCYSFWDYSILYWTENKLKELTDFVKSVDQSIYHFPENSLPNGAMDNRGQMGTYWKSRSETKPLKGFETL